MASYSLINGVNPDLPLPWVNLDTIQIEFDQDVDIQLVSLTLTGVNVPDYTTPDPGILFSYNSVTFTASYIFPSSFPTDALLINLDGEAGDTSPVRAAGGGSLLDGAFGPGSDFEQFFDILHGDANRNGSTSVTDVVLVSSKIPSFFPILPYDQFADVNGNHSISVTDLIATASNSPSFLPGGLPLDVAGVDVRRAGLVRLVRTGFSTLKNLASYRIPIWRWHDATNDAVSQEQGAYR